MIMTRTDIGRHVILRREIKILGIMLDWCAAIHV